MSLPSSEHLIAARSSDIYEHALHGPGSSFTKDRSWLPVRDLVVFVEVVFIVLAGVPFLLS